MIGVANKYNIFQRDSNHFPSLLWFTERQID